tara:strand:+ start:45 stop:419 length:375 start_codon:yes stop_codon:yes gene_type:complete
MADWSTQINVRAVSANPIVKLINVILGILEFLGGARRSGEMIEQNDYIVINSKQKFLWFFTASQGSLTIAKARISGVNVSTVRSWLFFSSNICEIYASGVSTQVAYGVKCTYTEIKERAESWLK